jgi:tetratricopeptide (TPR) repeat protein
MAGTKALRAWSKWAVALSSAWIGLAAAAVAAPSSYGEPAAPGDTSAAPPAAPAPTSATPPAASDKVEAKPSAPEADNKPKVGPSPHFAGLLKGHAAYQVRDFATAIAAYTQAIADNAAEPSAYYFLGQVELAAGQPAEAEATYQKGLKASAASEVWRTKLLFAVAEVAERQGRFAEARKAWEDLVQYAATHPPAKAVATLAATRMRVIDKHLDDETKYGAVKQRIEQRLRETGAPPPDESPRAPAKPKK